MSGSGVVRRARTRTSRSPGANGDVPGRRLAEAVEQTAGRVHVADDEAVGVQLDVGEAVDGAAEGAAGAAAEPPGPGAAGAADDEARRVARDLDVLEVVVVAAEVHVHPVAAQQ